MPRVRHVLRAAVSDFYFNSWRFLGANLLVGALVMGIVLASIALPWALALAILLVLPVAGTMRMATRLVRDFHTDLGDFREVFRAPWPILGIGLVQLAVTIVLVVDVVVAAAWRSWPGTFLLVSAAYGLIVMWTYSLVIWPLLLDPERDREGVRTRLRLALVVLLSHPVRVGAFAVLMGALLLVSALFIAPFTTFALSLIWLAIARWVLPLADVVEGRATLVVEASEP